VIVAVVVVGDVIRVGQVTSAVGVTLALQLDSKEATVTVIFFL